MNINQLSELVKKKILKNKIIKKVQVEDKSFLHRKHKSNELGKFHLKLIIESDHLKKIDRIEANKIIHRILENEIKIYIHSLQILFI